MKAIRALMPLVLVVAPSIFAAAETTEASFAWSRPILDPPAPGALFRIEVPFDVYARCHDFPSDIRIFDSEQGVWPFFLAKTPPPAAAMTVAVDTVNQAFVEGIEPHWRLDLHPYPSTTPGSRPRHDHVTITTTGRDFIRRVEIYGSEEQQQWALLGQGYLIHVDHPRLIQEDTIRYPTADYPYVQIRVYPNARDARETFTIRQARLGVYREQTPQERPVPHSILTTDRADDHRDAQVLTLDLGYENIPLAAVEIMAEAGGDYHRRAVAWLRNERSAAWRFAGAGNVYRMGESNKSRIPLHGAGRYLKVELYHDDDPPLSLTPLVARAPRHELVVQAGDGRSPRLWYGGEHVAAARHDLAVRFSSIAPPDSVPVQLGDAIPNPDHRRTGFGSWGPVLAGTAVFIAALIVLVVIVRMLKRMPAPQT
ncbi:MAG TPA: hypothetical protein PKA51_13110 [Kiritimatiellia bacterium]|nr:hypothetical protein [Kiritimatiellia bacterium]